MTLVVLQRLYHTMGGTLWLLTFARITLTRHPSFQLVRQQSEWMGLTDIGGRPLHVRILIGHARIYNKAFAGHAKAI